VDISVVHNFASSCLVWTCGGPRWTGRGIITRRIAETHFNNVVRRRIYGSQSNDMAGTVVVV
jgi:hypothetical protein